MSTKTNPKPTIPGGRPLQSVPEPVADEEAQRAAASDLDPPEPVAPAIGKVDQADRFAIVWLLFGKGAADYRETTLYTSDDPVDIMRFLAALDPGGGQLDVRDLDHEPYHLVTIDQLAELGTIAATAEETATIAETIEAARSSLERNRVPTDLFATTGEDDGGDGEATGNATAGTTTLFTVDDYNDPALAIPKIDGQSIGRIAVAFSGEIFLDRTTKEDVALYNSLVMGRDVELRVAAKVVGTGAKGATNRDGDLDVIVGKKSLTVKTLYVLTPEEL